MAQIKTYETTSSLIVAGVEQELTLRVRYSFWPGKRPSIIDPEEPAKVEIHRVDLALLSKIYEVDLAVLLDRAQFEALEQEILDLEEDR